MFSDSPDLYAVVTKLEPTTFAGAVGLRLPSFRVPTSDELARGALLLALPQIPLSLGNSVIATSQTTRDLFPERPVSVRKIGFTYGLMNLMAPWFGGVPVRSTISTSVTSTAGSLTTVPVKLPHLVE